MGIFRHKYTLEEVWGPYFREIGQEITMKVPPPPPMPGQEEARNQSFEDAYQAGLPIAQMLYERAVKHKER